MEPNLLNAIFYPDSTYQYYKKNLLTERKDIDSDAWEINHGHFDWFPADPSSVDGETAESVLNGIKVAKNIPSSSAPDRYRNT